MRCPFILIHIGDEHFPDYVNKCIEQIYLWNKDADVFFLANEVHRSKLTTNCNFISLETIPIGSKHALFKKHVASEFNTERLFVLEDFLEMKKLNECFHLENDTLIYFDMYDVLPTLREEYKGLATPYLGKGEVSFSILYVRDAYFLTEMNQHILRINHIAHTETQAGCRYFLENPHVASFLPTISKECETDDEAFTTSRSSVFNGLWDSGAYGQYIDTKVVNKSCSFAADQFVYTWASRNGGLWHPRVHRDEKSWPLYTLHIQSKNLSGIMCHL